MRPTTDFETLRKDPKLVFQLVKDKISSVNGDKYVNITDFSPWESKHMVGAFAEPANQSLKAQQRCQLPRIPRGDFGGLGCCRA